MGAWTDPMDEALRAALAKGLTSTQAAQAIRDAIPHATVTRNAVIGRATRLGIPLAGIQFNAKPDKPKAPKPPRERSVELRKTTLAAAGIKFGHKPEHTHRTAPKPLPPKPVEDAERVGRRMFADPPLRNHQCRWPLRGEGVDMIVCADATAPERPYCPAHCERAYNGWVPAVKTWGIPVARFPAKRSW